MIDNKSTEFDKIIKLVYIHVELTSLNF